MTKISRLIILIFWLSTIFYLSNQSFFSLPYESTDWKKTLILGWRNIFFHTLEYIIAGFWFNAFLSKTKTFKETIFYFSASFILGMLFAFSDELHQIFIVGRESAFDDLFFDGVGLVIGGLLYLIIN